jgi:hypothetical protein
LLRIPVEDNGWERRMRNLVFALAMLAGVVAVVAASATRGF